MANVTIQLPHGDLDIDVSRASISDHQFKRLMDNMPDADVTLETFLAECDREWLTLIIESNPKLERKLLAILKDLENEHT